MSDDEDDDDAEFGSKKRELKGYSDGLHSPWGAIGKMQIERGLTREQVLWDNAWINLLIESADQVRYRRGRKPEPVIEMSEAKRQLETQQ